MSLNDTPSANRVHIGFFGCRNAGKSSLVNAVTGQSLAVVSDVAGTTTDPVYKSMELLPLGPVVIIDTPGIDDTGELGELRVSKTRQVLAKIDVAVLVVDGTAGLSASDRELTELFKEKNINYIIAYNKSDLVKDDTQVQNSAENSIWVSAERRQGIEELKELIGRLTVTSGVLIVEAMAQTGAVAVLSLEENKGKNALFGGIDKLKFKKQVVPGDVLKLEVKIIKRKGPIGVGEAIATVDGKLAAKGELTFAIV